MKILENNNRYIDSNLLSQCFERGKHLKVDKVATGNGFSTAFLTETPIFGRINILIAPNKAVVMDKQEAYNTGRLKTNSQIGFFYKEGTDVIGTNFDVMVFVCDSFYLYSSQIFKIKKKINWILVDEAHSIEIQSSFRWVLRDFDYKVEKYLNENTCITSVTASPNYYTEIDIKIKNKFIPEQLINVTNDRNKTIERVKNLLKKGERVVIATNSLQTIYKLRDINREIRANYVIGVSLMRGCVCSFKVIQDNESNLTIISSRGFEGFD
jgi:hypothetical protein